MKLFLQITKEVLDGTFEHLVVKQRSGKWFAKHKTICSSSY